MTEDESTVDRRTVLKPGGGAAAVGVLGFGAAWGSGAFDGGSNTVETAPWETAETPTANTLYDVEHTAGGAYAVGGGGQVLRRPDPGYEKVVDGGPTGNGNSLFGADVPDDDARLWFVGASGAIGEYDVETGDLNGHSGTWRPTGPRPREHGVECHSEYRRERAPRPTRRNLTPLTRRTAASNHGG